MIAVFYAVCSEQHGKPLVRAVVENQARAKMLLSIIKERDGNESEKTTYWLAELGSDYEAWRKLARFEFV